MDVYSNNLVTNKYKVVCVTICIYSKLNMSSHWLPWPFSIIEKLFVCVCMCYVCSHMHTEHVCVFVCVYVFIHAIAYLWSLQDNFVELVSYFYLYVGARN